MSRKLLFGLAIAVVVIASLLIYLFRPAPGPSSESTNGPSPTPTNGSGTEVKIGVVLPLSGSMAEYGKNGQEGLELANEELRAKPGSPQIKLIYQDTKDAPQDTVSAVRRLIDVDQVKFIIGGLTSSGVLAAAPYAQQRGVLFFTPAASAPGIPEIGDMVFRNWPPDDMIGHQFGMVAYKRGIRTLAILHVSNDYGTTNSKAFQNAFTADGGKILLTRAFPQGTTDFKTMAVQVSALQGTPSVLIIAYPDEFRAVLPALAQAKVASSRLLVSDTFYSPQLLGELRSSTEGVLCAVADKPGEDYTPRQEFIARYKAHFKKSDGNPKEPGLVSDTAYDALNLVAAGISKTDGSPKAVSEWLLHNVKDYPGVSGMTSFTSSGDVPGKLALYQAKSGKFVKVKE